MFFSFLPTFVVVQENERSKDLIIEQKYHKQIIGTKGEKIREIRDRFNGVLISFPEQGEKKDVVSLRGPKNDVEQCANYMKKLSAELVKDHHDGLGLGL